MVIIFLHIVVVGDGEVVGGGGVPGGVGGKLVDLTWQEVGQGVGGLVGKLPQDRDHVVREVDAVKPGRSVGDESSTSESWT